MYLTSDIKKDIFRQFGGQDTNTGAAESQIALFTHRVKHLTEHLKRNKKDKGTQRALIALVAKRRKQLDYLKATEINRYREIIKELNLRK
ncbi:MAG: 30S ribosomal protein S15 [Bacteroidales bacterium]